MLSLFKKRKTSIHPVLTLPSYSTPTEELDSLAAKRDAQLAWMRQKGMQYLGDPKELNKRPQKPQPGPATRLTPVANPTAEKTPPARGQSNSERAD